MARVPAAVLVCLLGLLYLWVRAPLLGVPLDRDEGAFALIGQALLRGEWPYRDLFDHKPPGVFYVYALAVGAFGASTTGLRVFLLLWNAGTLVALTSLSRALFGSSAGWWTAGLFVACSASVAAQTFTASTEMLLLLPLVASLRLAVTARGRSGAGRLAAAALSGACGAAACWIKPPAALPLLAALGLLGRGRAVGAWLAGGIALSAAVVAPFAWQGVFDELWYWSVTHSAEYAAAGSWAYLPTRLASRGLPVLRELWAPVLLAVAGSAWLLARRVPHAWVAPVWLALSLASLFHSPFLYSHYFAVLAPPLALAGGSGLARALEALAGGAAAKRRALAAAAALVLAVAVASTHPLVGRRRPGPVEISYAVLGPQGFEASRAVAAYLRAATAPDAWIYIHGSEPQIAFLADRRQANPFVMLYPLTNAGVREREFQERAWARIRDTRPAYVVTVAGRRTHIVRPGSDPSFAARFERLLEEQYALEAAVVFDDRGGFALVETREAPPRARYLLWRRRGPSA